MKLTGKLPLAVLALMLWAAAAWTKGVPCAGPVRKQLPRKVKSR